MTPQNMSAIDGVYPPNTVAKSEHSASVQARSPSVRNKIAMRFLRNPVFLRRSPKCHLIAANESGGVLQA
jgi:hypothetical protein